MAEWQPDRITHNLILFLRRKWGLSVHRIPERPGYHRLNGERDVDEEFLWDMLRVRYPNLVREIRG